MIIVSAFHVDQSTGRTRQSLLLETSDPVKALETARRAEVLGYVFKEPSEAEKLGYTSGQDPWPCLVTIEQYVAEHVYRSGHASTGGLCGDYGLVCALEKENGQWHENWLKTPKKVRDRFYGIISEPATIAGS